MARKWRSMQLRALYGDPKNKTYAQLINEGVYLPSINNPALTRSYLSAVRKFAVVRTRVKKIQEYTHERFSKLAAYCILSECAGVKPLGFGVLNLPPTKWMINTAYTLNPRHRAFLPPEILNELKRRIDEKIPCDEFMRVEREKVISGQQIINENKHLIKKDLRTALLAAVEKLAKYPFVNINRPALDLPPYN